MQRIELKQGAWLDWDPSWLPQYRADELLGQIREETAWEERHIIALGKPVLQPRLVGWAGELPYLYSGQTLEPRAPTPALAALWQAVEEVTGTRFNHAVLNLYRDEKDHVALHADNEPELGRCPTIASVSLGATREFVIKAKGRRYWKRMRLLHGSLLVMGGTFQHRYRHAVSKETQPTEPRINVTLRVLHGPPGWRMPGDPRGAHRP